MPTSKAKADKTHATKKSGGERVTDKTETTPGNANIDSAEIAKFEAIANRWWDQESEFKPLHEINPLRLNFIDKIAGISGKRVLDVGCGGGILSESMARRGANVLGIDLGDTPLNVAKLHALEAGVTIEYQKISTEDLARQMADNKSELFDVITCMEMLEHVPDPASIIASCATMLKPGGHLFLSTINRNAKAYLFAVVGAEYILNMLPRGTHEYSKFIRPSELAGWARKADLDVQEIIGLVYNPLTKRYKLDKDIDVNYMVHTIKQDFEE
jgi:2-polyprenyl-6-hydroxyphenyl methylase/3-demethylubiquinone-9 3-methyltransferase